MRIYPGRIMNNFIEQNKRQYAIPVYQRNYEWSKDQCVKLFDDIVIAAQRGREHFCGSVVYSMVKYENNINHYIVIDGQQRMTTVYLLLKALMDMAAEEDIAAMTAYYNMDLMDKALAKAQIEGDIIDGVIRANLRDYLEGLEHEDDD